MPLVPPTLPPNLAAATPSTSTHSECPSCRHPVADTADKFCRKCGIRILMQCSKCHSAVKPADRFCAHCGAKRWQLIEFWRYGILHRSPIFVIGASAAATLAYVGLLFYLKRRQA
uniref:DZANK-type domain-containing protein n=1 Tax=Panagrellus redivivus TaxID=6233 RepID=A0A7E4US68_PANRE